MTFNERLHEEGRTILRVAAELRKFLSDAPTDDPDASSLFLDCKVLDRVGNWLTTNSAVTFADGISVAD